MMPSTCRAELLQGRDVVAGNADLDGRFHNHSLLQFLDDHERFGRRRGPCCRADSATNAGVAFSDLVLTINCP